MPVIRVILSQMLVYIKNEIEESYTLSDLTYHFMYE